MAESLLELVLLDELVLLLVVLFLASQASSSDWEICPSLLVSIDEKVDDDPEDDPPLEVEDPSLDELAEAEAVDDEESLCGGGGGGGALAFMKDESSDCDTEPSPSPSMAVRSFEASLVDDEPEVLDEEPSSAAEISVSETLPSPSVSSAANNLLAGSLAVVDEISPSEAVAPSPCGGGGGGALASMKDESSDCDTDPSPSVSIDEKRSDDDPLVDDELAVEEVPLVEDACSCTDRSAPRVSLDMVSTKLCSSLDDTPPEPSASSCVNNCDNGSLFFVDALAEVESVEPVASVAAVCAPVNADRPPARWVW